MARPSFKPTIEERRMVETLSGFGVSDEHLASLFTPKKIDPKTLRKHFLEELKRGRAVGIAKLQQTAYERATKGKDPSMLKFLLNTANRHRDAAPGGFREPPDIRSRAELIRIVADELDCIAATRRAQAVLPAAKDGADPDAPLSVEGLPRAA
jgi:hypothetical protein